MRASSDVTCIDIVPLRGAAVVFPNYSLSPEAKYPTALEESYAVARWGATHGMEKQLDDTRLAVAGTSVGGNMSAALTLLAKYLAGRPAHAFVQRCNAVVFRSILYTFWYDALICP